ncbi:mCG1030461, isoform CRA_b, partial [Mus musculus]
AAWAIPCLQVAEGSLEMGRGGQWAQHRWHPSCPFLVPRWLVPRVMAASHQRQEMCHPLASFPSPTSLQGPLQPPLWLTSNLLMNSEKMPKKASEVVALESSPKKARAFPSSSMASRCRPSNARRAGCAVSRKDYKTLVKETAPGALPSLAGL